MPPISQTELDNLNKLFTSISNGVSYAGGTVVGASASSLTEFCNLINELTGEPTIEVEDKLKENEWEEISV